MEYERDIKSVIMPDGDFFDAGDWKAYSNDYRKKPVVIQALKLECEVRINTLEGEMIGNAGDYLIKGVNGEFYPCKPDIFHKTYEKTK